MIRISQTPDDQIESERIVWRKLMRRAEEETERCCESIEAGEEYEFNAGVWGKLKGWLLKNLFAGKCGYCESPMSAVTTGTADHYRPKRGVSAGGGPLPKCGDKPHPGYYWLAYDWRNLVPACQRCNSEGKGTKFPVRRSHCCKPGTPPDELDEIEEPILLNPYIDHGDPYLVFDEFGGVAARDGNERGAESIRIYKLDREALNDERRQAIHYSWLQWSSAYASRNLDEMRSMLDSLGRGSSPYSLARWQAIKNFRDQEAAL